MSGNPGRCEDCGLPVATREDAERYAGGEGEHLCWGGCEPESPTELRAEIDRLTEEVETAAEGLRALVDPDGESRVQRELARILERLSRATLPPHEPDT